MALFEVSDVTPYLPPGIAAIISDTPTFEAVRDHVTERIVRITGIEVPADPDDAPAWIASPAAAFIAQELLVRLQSPSPELLQSIEKNVERATTYLLSQSPVIDPSSSAPSFSSSGKIEDLEGNTEL